MIRATLYSDAACPWAYSASPALHVLQWRYGAALEWRLVMIGLREEVSEAAAAAHDPTRTAVKRYSLFSRRYGMPFGDATKERSSATGRACRAVVAARLHAPGSEWRVFRALQLAYFTTPLLLDDDDVTAAYEQDRAEARSAAGTAAETQGKTSTSDGPVRFTAPSIAFEHDGRQLVAGGWQPVLAYDVLIANLDSGISPKPPPEHPGPLLECFPDGLTTAEVAALLADGPDPVPDLEGAQHALETLVAEGGAVREPLGNDALWKPA